MTFHFERFLDAFDQNGVFTCSCGRRHYLTTRAVRLGENALKSVPRDLASAGLSGARIWILSDENTEVAAGTDLKRSLDGFDMVETILPARPKPRTHLDLTRKLLFEALEAAPDLLLAVGAGTICDLVKKVSHDSGVPNWCVATAPSVDAYTSITVALKEENRHLSLPSRPPQRVIGDVGLLSGAPQPLFLSGLGDLAAKIISYLDWVIAARITGEHLCPFTAEFVLQSARSALETIGDSDQKRITETLTDAQITSGLTIQNHGFSRPAASAEHTVAHFWEASHAIRNESLDMHGVAVYVACCIVYPVYQRFFNELPDIPVDIDRRLKALRSEPPWEDTLVPGILPYKHKLLEESRGRFRQPRDVREHLRRFDQHRRDLQDLGRRLLPELQSGLAALAEAGLPTTPVTLRLDREPVELAFRYVKLMRNRYSCFDLMWELGVEQHYQQVALEFIDQLYRGA